MTNFGLNDDYLYRELALDSYDTANSGGNGQFPHTDWPLFQMPRPLTDIAALKILEVQIPASWYVFNQYNNTFLLSDGVVTNAVVTIPVGNYTSSQMIPVLQTQLAAVAGGGHTYVVTYSVNTGKFTITQSAGDFTLQFGNGSVEGNFDPSVALGFNHLQSSTASVLVAPNVALLSGPMYLYVSSQKMGSLTEMYLPAGAENHGALGPQMAKVPVNVSPEGIINWSDPDPLMWFDIDRQHNLSQIDFYLTLGNTNWGYPANTVPLPLNGLSFSIKLGILENQMNHTDPTVPAVSRGISSVTAPKGIAAGVKRKRLT